MLSRIRGQIIHKALDRVSPLAVPVMLEIGREMVYGEAAEALLAEAEADLVREAMGNDAHSGGAPGGHHSQDAEEPAPRAEWPSTPSPSAGVTFAADPAGALYWPEQQLLCVADLHLEKGSSFAGAACCCRPTTPAPRCTLSAR